MTLLLLAFSPFFRVLSATKSYPPSPLQQMEMAPVSRQMIIPMLGNTNDATTANKQKSKWGIQKGEGLRKPQAVQRIQKKGERERRQQKRQPLPVPLVFLPSLTSLDQYTLVASISKGKSVVLAAPRRRLSKCSSPLRPRENNRRDKRLPVQRREGEEDGGAETETDANKGKNKIKKERSKAFEHDTKIVRRVIHPNAQIHAKTHKKKFHIG